MEEDEEEEEEGVPSLFFRIEQETFLVDHTAIRAFKCPTSKAAANATSAAGTEPQVRDKGMALLVRKLWSGLAVGLSCCIVERLAD